MKNNFANHTTVSMLSPQVLSASRSGDKIKTTIQQIDNSGNFVNKDYELEIDSDNSNMQLTKVMNKSQMQNAFGFYSYLVI